jgi:undecaprenyl diphosphate synthase
LRLLRGQKLTILNHVALILDGNRRWAASRGLPVIEGYKLGADRVKETISFAIQKKLPMLSMYFFSTENWVRDPQEVGALFSFMNDFLSHHISLLMEQGIRIHILGRLDRLPSFLKKSVEDAVAKTSKGVAMVLNIALDYGGRDEILRALAKAKNHHKGDFNLLTEESFYRYLDLPEMPDPDLVIRTGGEMRISNFLIWQIAYSELFFSKKMWPDFTVDDFEEALTDYQQRSRRRGGDAQYVSRLV